VLQLTDDKFFDDNYDVWVGGERQHRADQLGDGHNHLYLYSYDQADPGSRRPSWSGN
jgi:hypothetical protein